MFWDKLFLKKKPEIRYETVEVPKIRVNITFYGRSGEKEHRIGRFHSEYAKDIPECMSIFINNLYYDRYLDESQEIIDHNYFQVGIIEYLDHEMIEVKREINE